MEVVGVSPTILGGFPNMLVLIQTLDPANAPEKPGQPGPVESHHRYVFFCTAHVAVMVKNMCLM